ncbi:flagellar hook-basal body protein [Oribacterium sp. WCC10]|uniref:flagellar hook-basal body protein n=1 Tax=Oribacterium sp. WCC10 TaxID=1855343 RepID=UPI0008E169CE|nr:flagellar hook-basal body complex protein [Oribacterium sp. WCC10]SFG24765.1 flagellar basal-body rod protein FlgG [Oribacterium sp. WCC10]
MEMSFWTGAVGADNFTKRLSVTSNNLANINTTGFKAKSAPFRELINYNLNDSREAVTELQAGAGAVVHQTNTNFNVSSLNVTNVTSDLALLDNNTFFMVQDPGDDSISYTRNGHFHSGLMPDGEFYLMTESGKYVLDQDGKKLKADVLDLTTLFEKSSENTSDTNTTETAETEEKPTIGVYTFPHPSRLLSQGDNEFVVQEGDTENTAALVTNPHVQSGALESSSTDIAKEMSKVVETQRAFSYALKVVTTSDEIQSTINQLR